MRCQSCQSLGRGHCRQCRGGAGILEFVAVFGGVYQVGPGGGAVVEVGAMVGALVEVGAGGLGTVPVALWGGGLIVECRVFEVTGLQLGPAFLPLLHFVCEVLLEPLPVGLGHLQLLLPDLL